MLPVIIRLAPVAATGVLLLTGAPVLAQGHHQPSEFLGQQSTFIHVKGQNWEEHGENGVLFRFEYQYSDADYLYLYDESRDVLLRLPLRGGEADWSHHNPINWTALMIVRPGP